MSFMYQAFPEIQKSRERDRGQIVGLPSLSATALWSGRRQTSGNSFDYDVTHQQKTSPAIFVRGCVDPR
jgi:hypothetical protein